MFDLYFITNLVWFAFGAVVVAALIEIRFQVISKITKKKGYEVVVVGKRDLRPVEDILSDITSSIINDKEVM